MDAVTPPEVSGSFIAARQFFWAPAPARRAPRLSGTLAPFLRAEYLPADPTGPDPLPDPLDRHTARLRRAVRLRRAIPPEELVAAATRRDHRLSGVVHEAWPASLRRHGLDRAKDALRRAILRTSDPLTAGCLLDLATSARLRPLEPADWARLRHEDHFTERPARHALWRHLADRPTERRLLPSSDTAGDPYEHLLLTAAVGGRLLDPPGLPNGAGLMVVQSMLVGSMDNPGEGLSGGLGVLLGSLGDALVRTATIDAVITLVAADPSTYHPKPSLVRARADRHWTLGLPVDDHPAATANPGPAIAWWTGRLLAELPRRPDLIHVRYADDRSLAVAEAARRLGVRLLFTATPDPHRRLDDQDTGGSQALPPSAEPRQDLHRVFVADRLVDRAHEVVALPSRGGTSELVRYFPQLARLRGGEGPSAPPEGIAAYPSVPDETHRRHELLQRLYGGHGTATLHPETRPLPVLLTVGRLHPVKQQHVLVRGWLDAGLYRHCTLIVVGGSNSPDTEDPEEREVRAAIADSLTRHPQAVGRLALVPALPNVEVRRLARALATSASTGRAHYVCPSDKEEFGIAVLEAMDAGLPVAATRRGGIPHYLHDGVNGLLLDTTSVTTLTAGLRRLLALDPADLTLMADRAAATVRAEYSIEAAAAAFAAVYARTVDPARPDGISVLQATSP